MGLERVLVHGWWSAAELDRLDAQVRRLRFDGREKQRRKLGAVQRETGRVALVSRALAELMIAKGLITKDELLAQIERIDLEDGVADGALDPNLVVPGAAAAPKPPPELRAPSPKVLARAKERVRAARETQPPKTTPPTPELLARARERLKEAREKKRRRNLP
jgi:hypothetical protein